MRVSPQKLFSRSLLLRLGLALASISLLAFLGMLSSVIIAETTQGQAGAVNQSGTLRMQSYRIAASLAGTDDPADQAGRERSRALMEEFQRRLESARLVDVLSKNFHSAPSDAYQAVADRWYREMRPALERYLDAPAQSPDAREEYLSRVDGFVAQVDRMVQLLEEDAESNIQLLRLIQGSSLFLTLVVVFGTMHLMHSDILIPLRDLLTCAEHARHGDFSVRTGFTGEDELGRLGHAFNVMAADLSKVYADLEQRVREKTRSLERTNRSLELLYNTSKRLSGAGGAGDEAFTSLLAEVSTVVGTGPGSICLVSSNPDRAFRFATTRAPRPQSSDLCCPPHCADCLRNGETHLLRIPLEEGGLQRVISIPIRHQERHYGVLLMELSDGPELESWQVQLLEAVARHIGMAINLAERSTEAHRLALLEERGVIARELHDSLAQSLSYLKIQVTRLESCFARNEGEAAARAVLAQLRDGLNSAYRELRELLTTFRLKMDGRGLAAALEATIGEYAEKAQIPITLENDLTQGELSPNEEIHLLQVVREALSNVARHAQASQAQVRLQQGPGKVVVTIEDDGIGMPAQTERVNHYGLAIMGERTAGLRGEIRHLPRPGGGTRVELTFAPQQYLRRAAAEAAAGERAVPEWVEMLQRSQA